MTELGRDRLGGAAHDVVALAPRIMCGPFCSMPPAGTTKAATRTAPKLRRDNQLEDTLKELKARRKKQKNPPLSVRIEQAGLSWSSS